MSNDGVDNGKRRFLTLATSAVGAVGAGFVAVPFLGSWKPSAKAQAAGAPVEFMIDKLEEGQMVKVEWRGKPVFVVRRSQATLEALKNSTLSLKDPESTNVEQQPEYITGVTRSIRPDILVLIGICTHLGCVPQHKKATEVEWGGGFFCPCHGSQFDLSGRVTSASPASKNLVVPPYYFMSDNQLMIGLDKGAA